MRQYDHRQASADQRFEGTRPVPHARCNGRGEEPVAGGQHVGIRKPNPGSSRHAGRLQQRRRTDRCHQHGDTVTYSGATRPSPRRVTSAGWSAWTNAGSAYTDCHNTGDVHRSRVQPGRMFIGGIVGGAPRINTEGFARRTARTAAISSFDFPGKPSTAAMFGGSGRLVPRNRYWTFSDCTNEGTFTVTFADPGHQFHSLGGILATGYGVFDNCVNKGKIMFNNVQRHELSPHGRYRRLRRIGRRGHRVPYEPSG